jgi:hypothetical protein
MEENVQKLRSLAEPSLLFRPSALAEQSYSLLARAQLYEPQATELEIAVSEGADRCVGFD